MKEKFIGMLTEAKPGDMIMTQTLASDIVRLLDRHGKGSDAVQRDFTDVFAWRNRDKRVTVDAISNELMDVARDEGVYGYYKWPQILKGIVAFSKKKEYKLK